MSITDPSPKALRITIIIALIIFVVLPNVLVRTLVNPGLTRPLFFAAGQFAAALVMVYGIVGDAFQNA